ncbi:PP2C family serine/threonine-protein phosphatase [Nocardioides sp.]|uniref:PP2C family protein-serine/threonine phosphatase n=1 Tax=Nocardioides sp. TaxID=35761 RepID=UPI00351992F8
MTEAGGDGPDTAPDTQPRGTELPQRLALSYSAISDVGRVRKDNQDSGYAGAWVLAVCDGVGGAARGDIASSTAISALRMLDAAPPNTSDSLLDRVGRSLHEAHEQIGRVVDADATLNGTSTTATVALFDGHRVGIGHVGDSRAYLFRSGEISQLTTDHTLVQTLIDEGRITEAEARTHPHRNLILKALDGVHEAEPDLFVLELVPGDRLLLCSDGASGVLDDGRLADILSTGSPDFAAVELVRASLEAGSSDNVTCLVADVLTEADAAADPHVAELEPLLVGAAAELKRRLPRGLFRGHRSGDTGELEPIEAELADIPGIPEGIGWVIPTDPVYDPESLRYAPQAPPRFRALRMLMGLVVVAGLVWAGLAATWVYVQQQYYVGEEDGVVVIYRGLDASLPGFPLSEVVVRSDISLDELSEFDMETVTDGIPADSLADAQRTVEGLDRVAVSTPDQPGGTTDQPTDQPTATPSPTASGSGG